MNLSLTERLFIPLLITALFALLSFGFMFGVRGASSRMKIVGLCAVIFVAGLGYSMFWHEQLTALIGWENAWIGMAGVLAVGTIGLCRLLFSRQEKRKTELNE